MTKVKAIQYNVAKLDPSQKTVTSKEFKLQSKMSFNADLIKNKFG